MLRTGASSPKRERTIVAAFPQPDAVPITVPSSPPMAQPVRQ